MWNKPWTIREGLAIGGGLITIGQLLQCFTGGIDWQLFAFPANLITLGFYLLSLGVLYIFRKRLYVVQYFCTPSAAVAAIGFALVLTFIMGITRQAPGVSPTIDPIGLSYMLTYWPFVLVYLWLSSIIALTTLHQISTFRKRKFPSLVCHVGLFIALVCGTLGSADQRNLKMYCLAGQPEWRAFDDQGNVVELPLAIELQRFILEEYPAELQKVGIGKGKTKLMKMPSPKRYASEVHIYTKEGETLVTTIEVNKPAHLAGWKIYQYSYDESMGAAHRVSIFQLVADPWLPFVYLGIGLLLLGAVLLFFSLGKTKDITSSTPEQP